MDIPDKLSEIEVFLPNKCIHADPKSLAAFGTGDRRR